MKTLLVCIFFSVFQMPCFAFELPKEIPSEIRPFEEQGTNIISWKSSDLNGDGLVDYLVVLEIQKANPSSPDMLEKQRPVLIVTRQKDDSLKLVKRNDNIVSCSTCGGTFVDGFAEIITSKYAFSITNHLRGTSAQTTKTYTFAYSRRDNTWQLVKVETNQKELNETEGFKYVMKPPNDFGKIDFTDLDSEFYLGQGKGYIPRKKKNITN